MSINRTSWSLNGGSFLPNTTYFNLNDSVSVHGYLQTVTVQYAQGRLPTASARIWIYSIIPVLGGFLTCNRYAIPLSQISTSQVIQTYTLPNHTIHVSNGTNIGVGIEDTSGYLATTSNSVALMTESANLSVNASLYFRPDISRSGIKLSYTLMT